MAMALLGVFLLLLVYGIIEVNSKMRGRSSQLLMETGEDVLGGTLRVGPIHGYTFGTKPLVDYSLVVPTEQVIRLTDRTLVISRLDRVSNLVIPLSSIQWMGTLTIRARVDIDFRAHFGLIVHYLTANQRWRKVVFIIIFESDRAFVDELSALSVAAGGPPLSTEPHFDAGAYAAARMEQDVYGQWSKIGQGEVYLTPTDLLLFDFDLTEALPLSQLRRIAVEDRYGSLNDQMPLVAELLRLEFEDQDGNHRVIGFKMRQAEMLAEALSRRSGVPYESAAGRKKKAKT